MLPSGLDPTACPRFTLMLKTMHVGYNGRDRGSRVARDHIRRRIFLLDFLVEGIDKPDGGSYPETLVSFTIVYLTGF